MFKEVAELELYLSLPDSETHVLCIDSCLQVSDLMVPEEQNPGTVTLASCPGNFPKWTFVLRTALTLPGSLPGNLRDGFSQPLNAQPVFVPITWPFYPLRRTFVPEPQG